MYNFLILSLYMRIIFITDFFYRSVQRNSKWGGRILIKIKSFCEIPNEMSKKPPPPLCIPMDSQVHRPSVTFMVWSASIESHEKASLLYHNMHYDGIKISFYMIFACIQQVHTVSFSTGLGLRLEEEQETSTFLPSWFTAQIFKQS